MSDFAATRFFHTTWHVTDGRVIAASFDGPLAEVRAREYANARNRAETGTTKGPRDAGRNA